MEQGRSSVTPPSLLDKLFWCRDLYSLKALLRWIFRWFRRVINAIDRQIKLSGLYWQYSYRYTLPSALHARIKSVQFCLCNCEYWGNITFIWFQVIGPSTEEASFLDYIIEWKTDLVKDFPHLNHVSPLVVNEQAMTVYIGRYLTPLNPPEEVVGKSKWWLGLRRSSLQFLHVAQQVTFVELISISYIVTAVPLD